MDLTFTLDRFLGMLDETLAVAADRFAKDRPTLRDQFATAALQGLLSSPHLESFQFPPYSHSDPEAVAKDAYKLADAMLKAREPKAEAV